RPWQYPDDLAGHSRFYTDRPVCPCTPLRVSGRRRDDDHRGWRADPDPGRGRYWHARPHYGALWHDLPRRAGAGGGADGFSQRTVRTATAARRRGARLLRVLGVDPAQAETYRRDP